MATRCGVSCGAAKNCRVPAAPGVITVRLPFRADAPQPLEILVEYAYCVVDYQCFFGEELLTVAARSD